jgi:acetyl esterase
MYRKYFEPKYGEVAPWVHIDKAQVPDAKNLKAWRIKNNFETLTDLTMLIRQCNCYDALMEIVTDDVRITRPDDEEVLLRIYHPQGSGTFPIMLFVHGGGWVMNNLDLYDYVPRYFARFGGIAVVAVDYRLAPEYKFPIGLEDSYAALEWAVANAKNFSGDPSSLTVCGDSAGGNISAALALMTRDRNGPQIHKQILIYPATNFVATSKKLDSEERYGNGEYFITIDSSDGSMGENYLPNPEQDAKNPYASPLQETNFEGVAPACFISAECDPLLDNALMYAAKLEDNGVPVEYHIYEGMLHGFINRTYQKTFEALDDIIAAVPPVGKE